MIVVVSLCQIRQCVNLTFEKGDTTHAKCITLSFYLLFPWLKNVSDRYNSFFSQV